MAAGSAAGSRGLAVKQLESSDDFRTQPCARWRKVTIKRRAKVATNEARNMNCRWLGIFNSSGDPS